MERFVVKKLNNQKYAIFHYMDISKNGRPKPESDPIVLFGTELARPDRDAEEARYALNKRYGFGRR